MELYVFFNAVWTGCMVTLLYTALRIFRRVIKHNLLVVSIEDALFYLFSSVYIFYQIFLSTNGVLRWYFFLGVVLGVWSIYTIWYGVEKVIKKSIKHLKKNE